MSLSDRYVEYLRARDANAALALAGALVPSQPFDAALLDHYAVHGTGAVPVLQGPWTGRTAWIAPTPPEACEAGQLWFDVAELTAMVLVPRAPPAADWHPDAVKRWTPFVGWLSFRPVAGWQYRAYLTLTGVAARVGVSGDFEEFAPIRIFGQDQETAPVTRLTRSEAYGFATWTGKSLASQGMWQAARRLRPDAMEVLWDGVRKEWIGYPEPEDDEALAISPGTIDLDLAEEQDLDEVPPPERRMTYRYFDWSENFGFRTGIYAETGLLPRAIGTDIRLS